MTLLLMAVDVKHPVKGNITSGFCCIEYLINSHGSTVKLKAQRLVRICILNLSFLDIQFRKR